MPSLTYNEGGCKTHACANACCQQFDNTQTPLGCGFDLAQRKMSLMRMEIQASVCPRCGSTVSGSLFCMNCGTTLRTGVPLIASAGADSEKPRILRSFSKRDVGWILFAYVLSFLSFRFDFLGHHRWFQHPMRTMRAAWIAILPTIIFALIYKIRSRDAHWKR